MHSEGPLHTRVPTHQLKPAPQTLQSSCRLVLPHAHRHTRAQTEHPGTQISDLSSPSASASEELLWQALRQQCCYVSPWTASTAFPPSNPCAEPRNCNIGSLMLSLKMINFYRAALTGQPSRSLTRVLDQ